MQFRQKSLALVIACSAVVPGFARADTAVQSLMRDKLESAHGVLDALALEDFGKIEIHAARLRDLSRGTTWYKADVPDFQEQAKSFQNSAQYLVEQAKAKNLEGVGIGYIRLTLGCMQCHNSVRAQRKTPHL